MKIFLLSFTVVPHAGHKRSSVKNLLTKSIPEFQALNKAAMKRVDCFKRGEQPLGAFGKTLFKKTCQKRFVRRIVANPIPRVTNTMFVQRFN